MATIVSMPRSGVERWSSSDPPETTTNRPPRLGFSRWAAITVLISMFVTAPALGDVFRPAYLELRETRSERYDVTWKLPVLRDTSHRTLRVVFPEGTEVVDPPRSERLDEAAVVERWSIRRPGGLVGQTVRIEGRAAQVSDVIARVQHRSGASQTERLSMTHPELRVVAPSGAAEIAGSYLVLGFEHILGGLDHLLFVLALLLTVRGGLRILSAVTAFTLAHSLTLGLAALGLVHVPGPPVEALIALSIVFVAAEAVQDRRGQPGLTARAPWAAAFAFGLLHGFGFAGALAEVGLPQTDIPLALLAFNLGVELGQLAFVAAVLGFRACWRRLSLKVPRSVELGVPYAIGSIAMFWVLQRIQAL